MTNVCSEEAMDKGRSDIGVKENAEIGGGIL